MVNKHNSQPGDFRFSSRLVALVGLFLILSLAISSTAFAQNDSAFVEQVGRIEADDLGIANPAGLTFSPADAAWHVVQARQPGRSPGTYSEIFTITPARDRVGPVRVRPAITDPINMVFDGRANRLLFYQSAARQLIEIATGPDGRLDPTVVDRHNARRFGLRSPQGMTVDPATGHLFILDSTGPRIIRIEPDPDGGFDQALISRVDLNQANLPDLRGLAFDPTDGHLYSFSRAEQALVELSPAGDVVGTRDVSTLIFNDPQSMVFAPSRDLTDDPSLMNLFIADSGLGAAQDGQISPQSEGQIIELSLAQPVAAAASTFYAELVQTIHTSSFSPPSPDPSAIAYLDSSDTLLIGDAEVDEMSIYAGANMFEITRSGILTNTWTTVPWSYEPTGLDYNTEDEHLFVADDNLRTIFELDPGDDGLYSTEDDDLRVAFDTEDFGCDDPEGIAFARELGTLFIADEVNSEIWIIKANGTFDGPPPQGDDELASFDTAGLGVRSPEAIAYNPENGLLYFAGLPRYMVAETTTGGTLVRMINTLASGIVRPGGLACGPSSEDLDVMHLYIADTGIDNSQDPYENDGKVYEMTLPPNTPDLSIVKAVEPAGAVPGGLITYTLTFYNGGEGTATGVVITDIIPVSVTVQSVVSSGVAITDTDADPQYAWEVEDLAPAEGGVITITAALSLNLPCWHTFGNTASITNTAGDSDPDNNSSDASVTVGGGVTVSPPSDAASADPGAEVVYTLQVTNTGSCIDTYDLALSGNTWSTSAPDTVGPLAPTLGTSVTLTVTVPADARCDDGDSATVTITSQHDGAVSDSSLLSTTATTFYSVTVSPPSDDAAADPGAEVVYTLQVTNTGNCTDTFDIALSGNTWDTDAPATVGPLAPYSGTSVPLTVTVPTDARCDDGDSATVTITSQHDDTVSDSSLLSTTANRVNAVTVVPPSDSAGGDRGTTVVYTLRLTNTGNCTDTFARAVSGNEWSVSAPVKVGPLAAGAGADVPVSVGVPTGARCGDGDSATVTFTSQDDRTTSASSDLTTTANTVRGVTVDPPSDTVSADRGAEVVYILQVTNTGNCTDTFDLDVSGNIWNTEAPTTVGPLAADAGASVGITVTVPTDALCGDDVATITVTSQDDGTASDSSLLTTTAKTVRGVTVSPPSEAAWGDPGAKVVYTLQVTNTGNCADTFDLEVSGNTWDTDAPTTVGSLAPGVSASLGVTVTVPTGARCDEGDSATVTVTSQHDGAVSDSSLLTTTANTLRGVTISPPSDAASADAGARVVYTLQVTNTGNCADTFDLAVSGNSWDTEAPTTVGSLAPGVSASLGVTVTVPTGALCDDDDSATVTVTSQHDGAVSDSSLLSTTANTIRGVAVSPPSDDASGDPGAKVVYTLQVTNTGNCADTFDLDVSGNTWDIDAPATVGSLAPGVSASLGVTVTVPTGARCGDGDSATVTITSQHDDTVFTSSDLTTSANTLRGVTVLPPSDDASGDPGAKVVYTLQVINAGNCADTFDLEVSGNTWDTDAPATVGPLAPNSGTSVPVTVTVPTDALCEDDDSATVTITSQHDGTAFASSDLTTTANTLRGVTVSPPSDAASADAGAKVVYTLQVTNTGNCTDTFDLAVSGNTWDTDAPATVGPLAPGVSASLGVTVTVPLGAQCGDDVAIITFTSQGDDSTSASSSLTTSVITVRGVTVEPSAGAAFADPGAKAVHSLQVTNTGNCTDTFDIALGGNTWDSDAPATVGPLAPGVSASVPVTVTVPTDAGCGDGDSTTATITSQHDDTVSDSSLLSTTANRVNAVTIVPPSDSAGGDPGTTVAYTLRLTNTGNCIDTFSRAVSGNVWPVSAPVKVGPLAPGAGDDVPVSVTVPDCIAGGSSDTAAVTFASQDDAAVSDSATLTTAANQAAPVAEDDEYTALEDTSLSVPTPGVLDNDSDANCDDLTASLDTLPSHGTIVLDLNGSFIYTPTANFEGIDTFTYSAHDGFLADTATVTLTITSGGDNPIVDAGEDQTVNEADTVHFSGSYIDPALRTLYAGEAIHWDFGDGRTTTGTLTPARAYRDNGEYTVTLTVTDTEGDVGQDWLLVTVLNIAPSVNAGPDRTAVPGEPLNFSGAFTDPGLDDTHGIVWDLGDDTTIIDTLTFSHAYEAPGVYTVTLTVTDDDGGVGSDTAIVNVKHRLYLPLVSRSFKP